MQCPGPRVRSENRRHTSLFFAQFSVFVSRGSFGNKFTSWSICPTRKRISLMHRNVERMLLLLRWCLYCDFIHPHLSLPSPGVSIEKHVIKLLGIDSLWWSNGYVVLVRKALKGNSAARKVSCFISLNKNSHENGDFVDNKHVNCFIHSQDI